MSAVRSYHQAVIVSGLPNVYDYIGRRNRTRMMTLNDDDDDDDGGGGTATIIAIIIIMIIFILALT
jgi:hypothetical protein